MAGATGALVVALTTFPGPGFAAGPYNPLEGNAGFLVFIEGDATLTNNESEGTVAIGGDLTIGGDYQVAFVSPGGYVADGEPRPSSLVVGGRVDWDASAAGAELRVDAEANVNIGDLEGSFPRWLDDAGAEVNTRVLPVPDNFDATPRIQLRVRQEPATVQWEDPIDFGGAFDTYRARSLEMADCAQSAALTIPGGGPVERPVPAGTGQLNIAISPGRTNVLNLTGEELNSFGTLNFTSPPTASAPLVINVDTTATGGVFEWTGFTFAGAFDATHILINFPDATRIRLTPEAPTVEGTIYAPRADLVDDSPSNTQGNVVGTSFLHGAGATSGGEVHNFPFDGTVDCDPAPSPSPCPTVTESPSPTPTVTESPSPTPTVTESPSPTPTTPPTGCPTPAPGNGGSMPVTGLPITGLVAVGAGLLAGGAALYLVTWRRRRHIRTH